MKTHKGRMNHHIGTGDCVEDLDLWPGDVVTVHEGYGYARFIMGPTGALERLPKSPRLGIPMPVAVAATVASGALDEDCCGGMVQHKVSCRFAPMPMGVE